MEFTEKFLAVIYLKILQKTEKAKFQNTSIALGSCSVVEKKPIATGNRGFFLGQKSTY